MKCPECGACDSAVVSGLKTDMSYWRKRRCKKCGAKFFTQEVTEDPPFSFDSARNRRYR